MSTIYQIERLVKTPTARSWTAWEIVQTRAIAEAKAREQSLVARVPHRIIPVVN